MRRLLVICIGLFFYSSVYAEITPDSSWDEIFHNNVIFDNPKINFKNYFVSVFSVCEYKKNGVSFLRAENPFAGECRIRNSNGGCDSMHDEILEVPRENYSVECLEWVGPMCLNQVVYTKTWALNYKIEICRLAGTAKVPLFTKGYTIPSCEN